MVIAARLIPVLNIQVMAIHVTQKTVIVIPLVKNKILRIFPQNYLFLLMVVVIGFEGSANKIGVGIVNEQGEILANVRRT